MRDDKQESVGLYLHHSKLCVPAASSPTKTDSTASGITLRSFSRPAILTVHQISPRNSSIMETLYSLKSLPVTKWSSICGTYLVVKLAPHDLSCRNTYSDLTFFCRSFRFVTTAMKTTWRRGATMTTTIQPSRTRRRFNVYTAGVGIHLLICRC